MKLHTVFITYNRLELTKRAIASYLETVTVPFVAWVVDNGSSDGTQEWLREWISGSVEPLRGITLLPENRYPGVACNEGWQMSEHAHWDGEGPTHLHRADNDFEFLPGWCEEVERMFSLNENLGQVGLRTDEEEMFAKLNVGGNCVIRRELWDRGLRWDERTWPEIRDQIGAGWTEDSLMSKSVKKMPMLEGKGCYTWDRVEHPCIRSISVESLSDAYYESTWADRGMLSWMK